MWHSTHTHTQEHPWTTHFRRKVSQMGRVSLGGKRWKRKQLPDKLTSELIYHQDQNPRGQNHREGPAYWAANFCSKQRWPLAALYSHREASSVACVLGKIAVLVWGWEGPPDTTGPPSLVTLRSGWCWMWPSKHFSSNPPPSRNTCLLYDPKVMGGWLLVKDCGGCR